MDYIFERRLESYSRFLDWMVSGARFLMCGVSPLELDHRCMMLLDDKFHSYVTFSMLPFAFWNSQVRSLLLEWELQLLSLELIAFSFSSLCHFL